MASRPDPLERARRRVRLTWIAGLAATAACALWAAGPLPPVEAAPPAELTVEGSSAAPAATGDGFLPEAFGVVVWTAPPPQPAATTAVRPSAAAPPPPGLRAELVGIITEQRQRQAALYDPASDRLLFCREGEEVLGCTVARIDEGSVQLRAGTRTHELRLRTEGRR